MSSPTLLLKNLVMTSSRLLKLAELKLLPATVLLLIFTDM